jgi:hypothetical protein
MATRLVQSLAPDYALLCIVSCTITASGESSHWSGTGLVGCSVQIGTGSSGDLDFYVVGFKWLVLRVKGIYTFPSWPWLLSCHSKPQDTSIGVQGGVQA